MISKSDRPNSERYIRFRCRLNTTDENPSGVLNLKELLSALENRAKWKDILAYSRQLNILEFDGRWGGQGCIKFESDRAANSAQIGVLFGSSIIRLGSSLHPDLKQDFKYNYLSLLRDLFDPISYTIDLKKFYGRQIYQADIVAEIDKYRKVLEKLLGDDLTALEFLINQI